MISVSETSFPGENVPPMYKMSGNYDPNPRHKKRREG